MDPPGGRGRAALRGPAPTPLSKASREQTAGARLSGAAGPTVPHPSRSTHGCCRGCSCWRQGTGAGVARHGWQRCRAGWSKGHPAASTAEGGGAFSFLQYCTAVAGFLSCCLISADGCHYSSMCSPVPVLLYSPGGAGSIEGLPLYALLCLRDCSDNPLDCLCSFCFPLPVHRITE